jgi:hypothetical protein
LATGSACGDGRDGADGPGTGYDDGTDSGLPTTTGGSASSGDGDGDGDIKLDVSGGGSTGGGGGLCKVGDGDENGAGTCDEKAPPNSFAPEVQWDWLGPGGEVQSTVTPLVANLTDDDGNDEIDLCDDPDIVVIAYSHLLGMGTDGEGYLYVLDGATGEQHLRIDHPVWQFANPALGDIDDDGVPELIAGDHATKHLVAFEHDGTLKWVGEDQWDTFIGGAVGLADLDNDGDVEIYTGDLVADHLGQTLFEIPPGLTNRIATAADLDGDGDLEVITSRAAFHHDGTQLYAHPDLGDAWGSSGFSQIADVDLDGKPEVVVTYGAGITVLEDDGTIKFQDATPAGGGNNDNDWARPAALHDIDGDGAVELIMSIRDDFAAFDFAPLQLKWKTPVEDMTGVAGGTAFDFLGDAIAEAMYADETRLHVFDGQTGQAQLQWPRFSRTGTEYPTVADVDNDGSAEIVVVSNEGLDKQPPGSYPTVVVIRDDQDRWIQPRRIWNQHAYHVTNVREDGTIPQFEQPNWETFNTFRTNAQIAPGGQTCIPPEG